MGVVPFAKRFSAAALVVSLLVPAAACSEGPDKPFVQTPKSRDDVRKEQVQAQFSSWDGSHKGLSKYIKQALKNPDSYEHIETRYDDRVVHLVVTTTYRCVDASGKSVKKSLKATVDLNGNVIEILSKAP